MDEIKAGDVVQLKSGGPEMAVKETEINKVHCIWFAGNEIKTYAFPKEVLLKIR